MKPWNVMIVALGDTAARACELGESLRSCWTGSPLVTFTCSQPTENELAHCDAVVMMASASLSPSSAATTLDACEEASIPVLVLLNEAAAPGNYYEFAGAILQTWDTPPAQLAALLQGLLHRQREIRRMKTDADLTQRCHGGLKGQIAKIHEELQLAALVQREFLPSDMPKLHGVECAALWRPSNYVSGDIYDLVRLDEDRIGVFIADAVGHGVPAALMTMVICRSLITREAAGNKQRILPPAEAMERLNAELIRRQGQNPRFATAVYAVIDCRQRLMQVATAGHPPPIQLCGDGSSHSIQADGSLLGVFPGERYSQVEIELAADDRVLFYTDGFEQAFPSTDAGAESSDSLHLPTTRYRQEFEQLLQQPSAAQMIDVISNRLNDQAGSLHQVDDITLVCVHARALANHSRNRPGDLAMLPFGQVMGAG